MGRRPIDLNRRIYVNIRNSIKYLIEQKGISQTQLAEELGYSRDTFWAIKGGTRGPSLDCLEDIAKYFCLKPEDLISGKVKPRIINEVKRVPGQSYLYVFDTDIEKTNFIPAIPRLELRVAGQPQLNLLGVQALFPTRIVLEGTSSIANFDLSYHADERPTDFEQLVGYPVSVFYRNEIDSGISVQGILGRRI